MDKKVVGLLIFVALVIMAVILIATSLKKLSSKEVGLQYDVVNKDLGDKVFTEGLHTGPPGFEFIIFPNVFTTMQFGKLVCLNMNGVRITMSISYQFRIQMTNMRQVVMNFQDFDGYERVLRKVGTAVLHEACSNFNTSQFQTMRGEFETEVSRILSARYNELGCDVEGLQVNNIQRPSEYERAIKSKERAKEDIEVAKNERPRLETAATTLKREAESEAQIILNKAQSEARILNQLAQAEAKAITEQYAKEAEAYEAVMGKDGLGFTPEGFISYMGVRVIADAKNPVHIGLNSPAKSSFIKT